MKVLIASDTYLPHLGGVEISIHTQNTLLTESGHKTKIVAPKYPGDTSTSDVYRFGSVRLPNNPDVRITYPSQKKIQQIFEQFKPDVVHVHTPGIIGLAVLRYAKKNGYPVVYTYHIHFPDSLSSALSWNIQQFDILNLNKLDIERTKKLWRKITIAPLQKTTMYALDKLHNKVDHIIAPSNTFKQYLVNRSLETPVTVVSNGINVSMFTQKTSYDSSDKILHVGRISYEKNVDLLIMSMHEVLRSRPKATLHIYGDGPADAYLKRLVKREKLDHCIFFHGPVPNSELPRVYQAHDLFVTASTMETQCIVLLEALASGLPCVGADSLAIPELITNGVNGYLAKPRDVHSLAQKIVRTLEQNLQQLGNGARETAMKHDTKHTLKKLLAVYDSMLQN